MYYTYKKNIYIYMKMYLYIIYYIFFYMILARDVNFNHLTDKNFD